jgi:Ser/Thr protein kinase RdoA (MazF antagonist)
MTERDPDLYRSVERFKAQAYRRVGQESLPAHLEKTYGVSVAATKELDGGVVRIDLADGAPWVARVFPAARPLDAVEGDAEILQLVARHDVPAERCVPDPMSVHEGQGVLVTELVPGTNARGDARPALLRRLGELLGRLHTFPEADGAAARPAGSWHSLSIHGGGRSEDVRVLGTLFEDAKSRAPAAQQGAFDDLVEALAGLDVGDGLPTALAHPDLCSANVILTPDDETVLVDWTGAGTAPRIGPLGFLLATTGGDQQLIEAVVAGYRPYVTPTDDELDRLPDSVRAFPLVLDAWGVIYWAASPRAVLDKLDASKRFADSVAAHARRAFAA